MHLHFCGNPAHDLPMLLSAVVAEGPMLVRFFSWLKARFTRRACQPNCEHGHAHE